MSRRVEIGPTSVPRLPRHVRLQFDDSRKRWIVQAPERLLLPDDIALEILKLVDGVATVDVIADALAAKFAAPRAEVGADVAEMLQDLADKGLLEA